MLFPGSVEKPDIAARISNQKSVIIKDGGRLRYCISHDRCSQLILEEGCTLSGDAETVPLEVGCKIGRSGEWLLLEADSFNGKKFTLSPKIAGIKLKTKTVKDGETERVQLWAVRTTGFLVTVR